LDLKIFKSKVDWWVALVLILSLITPFVVLVLLYLDGAPIIFGILPFGILIAIYIGLVFPLRYELREELLLVRSGLMRIRIPYNEIVEVLPSRSLLSSPAFSIDRLKITRNKGSVLISPLEKETFLRELAVKTEHLDLNDNRLIPKSK